MNNYGKIVCLVLAVVQIKTHESLKLQSQKFSIPSDALNRISSLKSNLSILNNEFKKMYGSGDNASAKLRNLTSIAELEARFRALESENKNVKDCSNLLNEKIDLYSESSDDSLNPNKNLKLQTLREGLTHSNKLADDLNAKILHQRKVCESTNDGNCLIKIHFRKKIDMLDERIKNLWLDYEQLQDIQFSSPMQTTSTIESFWFDDERPSLTAHDLMSYKINFTVVYPVEDCLDSKLENPNKAVEDTVCNLKKTMITT